MVNYTAREYQIGFTNGCVTMGMCLSCSARIQIDISLALGDDPEHTCGYCGRTATRLRLISNALRRLDGVAWGTLGADVFAFDQTTMHPDERLSYTIATHHQPAKWLYAVAEPSEGTGPRYVASVAFGQGPVVLVGLLDRTPSEPVQDPRPDVPVTWVQFGLVRLDSVPAWRQALQAASRLAVENPSASIVLSAAGYEAYFNTIMRQRWVDRGLDIAAYDRLSNRVQGIANRIEWLPSTIGEKLLREDAMLFSSWQEKVNRQRNRVVHDANLHMTFAESSDALSTVVECIEYQDKLAFVRPHAYFL